MSKFQEFIIKDGVLLRVHPDLTEYTIPSHIKIIGREAFKNSKVKEIDVPYGVTKLDICAFDNSSIERIFLPETLKIVDRYAFSLCTNLTELTIPRSVSRIGEGAFYPLPNCVLTILNECDDENVFRVDPNLFGCLTPNIKEVRVPYGSVVWRYAVKTGQNVTTLPCSPEKFRNHNRYHYIDDMFCCEGSTLHEYFGHAEVVSVPNGIQKIDANAFQNADLKKIYLPQSVKQIEKYGFSHCRNLIEVLGQGITELEQRAFYDCEKLERVTFPQLKKCYDLSFENCARLMRKNTCIPDDAEIIKVEVRPCKCRSHNAKLTPFEPVENRWKDDALHKRAIQAAIEEINQKNSGD